MKAVWARRAVGRAMWSAGVVGGLLVANPSISLWGLRYWTAFAIIVVFTTIGDAIAGDIA